MGVTIRGQIVVTFRTHTTLILKGKAERKVHLNSSPFDWIGLPQTSTTVWHIHCFREYEKLYTKVYFLGGMWLGPSFVQNDHTNDSSPCCCRCAMLFYRSPQRFLPGEWFKQTLLPVAAAPKPATASSSHSTASERRSVPSAAASVTTTTAKYRT